MLGYQAQQWAVEQEYEGSTAADPHVGGALDMGEVSLWIGPTLYR